jgi:nucleoside-triphosphatase
MRTVNALKEGGYNVGGMISREVREGGARVGFEILDLHSSKRGWLANVNQKSGPQVGKYRVNIEGLNTIGAQAITDAVKNCDVIAIDEIGPMELFSEGFKEATRKALESHKLVIAIVHSNARDALISEARRREDAETITVTYGNREKLHEVIVERVLRVLRQI